MYDIIIIGSGLGGLLSGYILSKEGFSVCMLEKEAKPGGNLLTFKRHGHEFETGVHYLGSLGQGQPLRRYWDFFGLMNDLPLQQLDRDGFDRISFGNEEFPLAQGFDNFIEQLLRYYPHERETLVAYIKYIRDVAAAFPLYNLEFPVNQNEQQYTNQSIVNFLQRTCQHAPSPLSRLPRTSVPLSSVLSGNNYLYGGSSLTPLHTHSLISHSFISGAYRIVGGSGVIAVRLASSIRSNGGTILTKQQVTGIEKVADTFEVQTNGSKGFQSRRVISAIHPATTLRLLEPGLVRPAYFKRISGLQNTPSPFILFLSLKPGMFRYMNHNHYVHATPECWDQAGSPGNAWPVMYLLTSGCHKPEAEFADTVTILTYMQFDEVKAWESTSTGHRPSAYDEFKQQKASRLMEVVAQRFPELIPAVAHIDIATPLTYRDYTGTPEGSMYGIQKDFRDPMLSTVHSSTKLPGLYFTGQNTNLHGILGVTISAVMTCGEIIGLPYLLNKIKHV